MADDLATKIAAMRYQADRMDQTGQMNTNQAEVNAGRSVPGTPGTATPPLPARDPKQVYPGGASDQAAFEGYAHHTAEYDRIYAAHLRREANMLEAQMLGKAGKEPTPEEIMQTMTPH